MPEQITAILDANVLYPFLLRDLLLSFAQQYLYIPKWSDDIEREWSSHLIQDRPDIEPDKIKRISHEMNRSFENAKVIGYKEIENNLQLPDPDDKHVLAAAIVSRADLIVTFNLKDFEKKELSKHNIHAVHPDDFVINLIDQDEEQAKKALKKMVNRRKNPPTTEHELISMLEKSALPKTSERFYDLFEVPPFI